MIAQPVWLEFYFFRSLLQQAPITHRAQWINNKRKALSNYLEVDT